MRLTRPAGRNAAAMKYDILTALGVMGCGGDKHLQRLVLRFITLIVARYNWQTDELNVGQREIAALWTVDERTVKRDLARLRERGWLVQKRAAARGRVAVHGLDLAAILEASQPDWARVGADFEQRLSAPPPMDSAMAGNVITFPGAPSTGVAAVRTEGQGPWARVQAQLAAENPAQHAAWFAALIEEGLDEDGRLRLRAPSRFHATFVSTHHLPRLAALLRSADPGVRVVDVLC